jgi:hypothetical protein
MARTIGAKYKKMILEIMKQGKKEGIVNYEKMQEYVREKLPDEAFDTWESAYSEINGLVVDYWDKVPDPRPMWSR